MIGANGFQGDDYGTPTGTDLRVYGLRLSNTIRYQNNGPGQVQTRVDAPTTPVNDACAYFGKDANTICFLSGTDNPATAGRVVTVQQRERGRLTGFSSGHLPSLGRPLDDFEQRDPRHPSGVFASLRPDDLARDRPRDDDREREGDRRVQRDRFLHRDRKLQRVPQELLARGLRLTLLRRDADQFWPRHRVRDGGTNHDASSRVLREWENIFVAFPSPVTECVFKARGYCYGGNYSITNLTVDFEGSSFSHAASTASRTAWLPRRHWCSETSSSERSGRVFRW